MHLLNFPEIRKVLSIISSLKALPSRYVLFYDNRDSEIRSHIYLVSVERGWGIRSILTNAFHGLAKRVPSPNTSNCWFTNISDYLKIACSEMKNWKKLKFLPSEEREGAHVDISKSAPRDANFPKTKKLDETRTSPNYSCHLRNIWRSWP